MKRILVVAIALLLSGPLLADGIINPGGSSGGGAPSGPAGGGLAGTYPNPTVATVPATALPAFTGDTTTSAGSTVTTTNKIAGVDQTTAWTSYTPTVSCQSGALTSVTPTGAYKAIGKTIIFSASVLITTNGTCAGYLVVSLPTTLATATVANAVSNNNSSVIAYGTSGSSTVYALKYDGTYPGTSGNTIMLAGTYQSP